jgi:peptidoglycan hydrolase CwlO-like protein
MKELTITAYTSKIIPTEAWISVADWEKSSTQYREHIAELEQDIEDINKNAQSMFDRLTEENKELKQTQKRYEDQNVRLIKEKDELKKQADCTYDHIHMNVCTKCGWVR